MEKKSKTQNRDIGDTTCKKQGMDYLWLALTAFGGLGLEAVYAFALGVRSMVHYKKSKERLRFRSV